MKLSKRISLILSGAILVSSLVIPTVFASNWGDTPWSMPSTPVNSTSTLTDPRSKEDDTSAYGSIEYGNEDRNYGMYMQLKTNNGSDLTGSYRVLPPVYFGMNESHYIQNYAYENGYRSVTMYISKYRPNGCGASSGQWSPDSI